MFGDIQFIDALGIAFFMTIWTFGSIGGLVGVSVSYRHSRRIRHLEKYTKHLEERLQAAEKKVLLLEIARDSLADEE